MSMFTVIYRRLQQIEYSAVRGGGRLCVRDRDFIGPDINIEALAHELAQEIADAFWCVEKDDNDVSERADLPRG